MEVYTLHFSTIDSTQTWAKKHLTDFNLARLTCVIADIQTGGYGRFSRNWVSKKGNLHMSLVFSLKKDDLRIPNLGQLLAYSVLQFLFKHHLSPQIKWPNDILIERKKICGILVETLSINEVLGVIIGLGMNVNTHIQTDQQTTSLREITKKTWDLEKIQSQIISYFLIALEQGFPPLKEHFEKNLAYKGEEIFCQVNNKKIQGILIGITKHGKLLLKKKDDEICEISSGDIQQLRPI